MKRFFLNITFALGGLGLSLLALEVLFRLFSPGVTPVWSDRPTFYFQAESAETLQDYLYSKEKPAHTFRMAVVGDSFSFAPFMQFTDSFPKKLEQMLNLNNSALRAEVINYSVPAYSTTHEVPKVELALQEQADLVILQITLNDPEVKGAAPIGITNFTKFGPFEVSGWWGAVLKHWKSMRFVIERLHNSRTRQEYEAYFQDLFNNPRSYEPFAKALEKIGVACRDANKPLVAVIFPLFGLPLDQKYPFYPIHEKVGALLRSLNIRYFDISDIYKGIPLERLQVIPGVDRHPNEIAHRMAAEKIYSWLVDQKLIPQDLVIKKRFKKRTQIIKEEPFE